jgi:K+-sensing histidine kinase KdpD
VSPVSSTAAQAKGGSGWSWIIWLSVLGGVTVAMLLVRSRLNEAHVALVYLLVVQLGSAREGRRLGIPLAGAAFLLFDWFFVQPYGTLMVAKSLDWAVLGAFLVTSVVAAQLFERARAEAETARQLGAERVRLGAIAEHADVLREASRLKDAVIASVSHDLRTPLTTIKALAADLASDGDERAMTIVEEADRLNALVADLLDISRLNSGTASLKPEPNEAEDLIGALLQRITGATDGREINVLIEEGDPLLIGRFDFPQTLRALVNLVENALKYSPPHSPVEIGVRKEGAWLAFSVGDRGEGVPVDERERIFEPFYRKPGLPPDVGGSGLGLSIARAVAEAQGSSLAYEAREGGGSVFTIRVPAIDLAALGDE